MQFTVHVLQISERSENVKTVDLIRSELKMIKSSVFSNYLAFLTLRSVKLQVMKFFLKNKR